jgi:hypothetical protein
MIHGSDMCKVYNSIGSLMAIKSHLRGHNVNEFKSVNELIKFQKNYSVLQQEIISHHSILIEQERDKLSKEIAQLNDFISRRKSEIEQQLQLELDQLNEQLDKLILAQANIFKAFVRYWKKASLQKKIQNLRLNFNLKIEYSIQDLTDSLNQKSNRYQYIISSFDAAVNESSLLQLRELQRKKRIVDQVNTSIYGAFGERMVVRELENLPDDYILINNFTSLFDPPIYHRDDDDYISSIQIDHLLLSPAGIFLIETKNWSEQSLNNASLRSPVQQVKRANFALFKLFAEDVSDVNLKLHHHHWGSKKVPIKNVVVLTKEKPSEEFQYVKVLALKELLGYVKYFEPSFSNQELQRIANYLLNLNGQINVVGKIPGR